MSTATTPEPRIAGYTGIRRLGGGPASAVYLCRQRGRRREVAVKVAGTVGDDGCRRAIRNEIACLSRIPRHPNIVRMLDCGVTGDGADYLVLEYASGGAYRVAPRRHRTDALLALDVGIRIADALHAVHRAGIVHRDVKPSNILKSATGNPVLADFGVAASMYQPQMRTGHSDAWAAPEVRSGASGGTVAADIYSLGATLWALTTGTPPPIAGSRPIGSSRPAAVSRTSSPKPRTGDVPAPMAAALRRSLDDDPERRYRTAAEFANELRRIRRVLRGRTPAVYGHAAARPRRTVPAPVPTPTPRSCARFARRDDRMAYGAVAAMTAIALLLVVAVSPHADAFGPVARLGGHERPSPATMVGGMDGRPGIEAPETVPAPTRFRGVIDGETATFSWTNPDPMPGDSYAWSVLTEDGPAAPARTSTTDGTAVTIADVRTPRLCMAVSIVRENRAMSEPAITCAAR